MPRFENNSCYQCDSEGTGREHVPPKCLFPKGTAWSNLMTVPSCELHNNAKSQADEYLMVLLGAIAVSIPNAITSSAARSVVRLAQMGSRSLHKYGCRWNGNVLVLDDDFRLDIELLCSALEKVARGVYFYHHLGRRKLLGKVMICPLFVPVNPSEFPELASAVAHVRASTAADFERQPKLGTHQNIFAYQISEGLGRVAINMEFYSGHRVAVVGMIERSAVCLLDNDLAYIACGG